MVEVKYGKGKTEYGPGVLITFDADDICKFIISALQDRYGITIGGARTIKIGGELVQSGGSIYVDPSGSALCGSLLYRGRGPSGDDAELDREQVIQELKKLPADIKVDEARPTPIETKVEMEKIVTDAIGRVRKLWDRLGLETRTDVDKWMEEKPRAAWEMPGKLRLDHVTEIPPEDLPAQLGIKERAGQLARRFVLAARNVNENGLKLLSNAELETGLSELMGWTEIRHEEWEEDGRKQRGVRGVFNGCRQRLPNYVLGDTGEANFTAAHDALVKSPDDEVRLLDALFQVLGADSTVPREQLKLHNAGIKDCSMALLLMKRPELFR